MLFLMPYRTFMPKFSAEVMGFDAAGLGLLLAAPGAGSMVASLVIASLGDLKGKGRLMVRAAVAAGICLFLFSQTRTLWPAMAALAILGAASNANMITNNTLLQTGADIAYRGRVMSVYMSIWGLTSVGTMPAGAIADNIGVAPVLAGQGVLVVLGFLALAVANRKLLRMD
jgi:predicted MFS family arabinose efflux permease